MGELIFQTNSFQMFIILKFVFWMKTSSNQWEHQQVSDYHSQTTWGLQLPVDPVRQQVTWIAWSGELQQKNPWDL